jgi:hypothetical protein
LLVADGVTDCAETSEPRVRQARMRRVRGVFMGRKYVAACDDFGNLESGHRSGI